MKTRSQLDRQIFHVVPNLLCGWDFKKAGENTVLKYSSERENLRLFAKCYCRKYACDLIIYNFIGEVEDIISFQGE